ncbi:PIN-like domain-containing protein [Streptomyces sp. NPDC059690]|uniref:PIN-like domain-containing protein n=1 Tax=Streptomyces sp. NPDC059690 TaxID=3346907 RepID=UPI00369B1395
MTEVEGSFVSGYEAYRRRSPDEIQQAIKTSSIVLDTNALLNLYRMASGGREEYFAVLDNVADRLWIPRQVADEFHKNRLSAVASHISGLRAKADNVSEAVEALKKALKDFARLYSLANGRVSEYMEPLDAAISSILTRVHGDVKGFDLDPGDLASADPILDRLTEILGGKVGDRLTGDELKAAYDEAKRRGEGEIPPGYIDWKAKGEEGAGDYLIWREMLTFAASGRRSILFVSTDVKDDWLRRQAGFLIGPRPELVQEMREEAGASYHHITLADFLRTASTALGVFVSPNTISRARELESSREMAAKELEMQVAAARQTLVQANYEHSKDRARLADIDARKERIQSQYSSLLENADRKNTDPVKRAALLSQFDALALELVNVRDERQAIAAALEASKARLAAAEAMWARLEQKSADLGARY